MNIPAYTVESPSPQTTRRLGRQLGNLLEAGMVVCLEGDLGSGKTVMVQGIAQGLSVPDTVAVTSPTYGLLHDYPARIPLYHADLYRLPQGIDPDDFDLGDVLNEENIVIIEWADRLAAGVLDTRIDIRLSILGETTRRFTIGASGQRERDLVERLGKLS